MNAFERALNKKIQEHVPDLAAVTPGVIVDVHLGGRRKGVLHVGRTYDYYDLASLTKIIFTGTRSIHHFGEHRPELEAPLRDVLDWWPNRSTTPFDLMTHTAGLDWWQPVYKKLKGPMIPEKRWAQMVKWLHRVKPRAGKKAIYSDLDLWSLGAFLNVRLEQDLLPMWHDVQSRLEIDDLFFHPGNRPKFARARYAPTEDCPWRGRVLQGEVHDENAWSLGGVAPHAGLFGSVEAVSAWGLHLRRSLLGARGGLGDPETVRYFAGRRIPKSRGDWGLCFMKPSSGRSSCGRHFSRRSCGHTGFTGTSIWYDPVHDLLVAIMSNRVHPTRENKAFLSLRRELHDWVFEILF